MYNTGDTVRISDKCWNQLGKDYLESLGFHTGTYEVHPHPSFRDIMCIMGKNHFFISSNPAYGYVDIAFDEEYI